MPITGLAFLACYGTGLLFALARHPIYGLATYVVVLFVHPPSRWWGAAIPGLRWSLVAALITLTAVLIHRRQDQRNIPSHHGIFIVYLIFSIWITIQIPWAMLSETHNTFVTLYWKYMVLLILIYSAVDSERHLRLFLWSYVVGCFYLGWIAYSAFEGGRFEGFGGPNMGESNAGALALVTGVFAAAPLFLKGTNWERAILIAMMPFIVNGVVTAVSRSAFVALIIGGAAYLWYSPKKYRKRIIAAGSLGVVLFVMLTNPQFWARMASLKHAGEGQVTIESEIGSTVIYDSGQGRIDIMKAQWQMFLDYPFGSGHRGTVALSTSYMSDELLTSSRTGPKGRASHNTFFSLLVEQGILGAIVYFYIVWWCYSRVRYLYYHYKNRDDFGAALVPALAGILVAIIIGDVFVDYLKMEPRLWYIAIMMAVIDVANRDKAAETREEITNGEGRQKKPDHST